MHPACLSRAFVCCSSRLAGYSTVLVELERRLSGSNRQNTRGGRYRVSRPTERSSSRYDLRTGRYLMLFKSILDRSIDVVQKTLGGSPSDDHVKRGR
jgi:hypothetical protein